LNRTELEQYGIEWRVFREDFFGAGFLGAGGGATGALPAPLGLLASPEDTTFAFIWPDENVSILLQALQTEGLANILAQPKLLAMSGQSALFQSGGEIPIRTSTGFAAEVEFKDFGTLITFTPTVMESGDIILTVTPEVSQADFANLVEGIPTFRTRRASTSARLRNGQTLVIGGLLQTSIGEEEEGVPYLKDIPLVGRAFSTTTYDTEVQELMVIVRPRLVEPLLPGTEVPLPVVAEPMQREDVRTKASPAKVTRPRVPGLP
jgi:pilus assembly protein CpaC